jgi:hypothetical protein
VLLKENFYEETDLNKDGVKEIIVSVTDTIERDTKNTAGANLGKIFIFSIVNEHLKIMDTSRAFELDGKGLTIELNSNTLSYSHSFHRGEGKLFYKFNLKQNRFLLSRIEYSVVESFKDREKNPGTWQWTETFTVTTSTLTVESEKDSEEGRDKTISKKRSVLKKIPKNFSLTLSGLHDVNNDYEYFDPLLDMGIKTWKYIEY